MRARVEVDVSFWIDEGSSAIHRILRPVDCGAFEVVGCGRASARERPISLAEIRHNAASLSFCPNCVGPNGAAALEEEEGD